MIRLATANDAAAIATLQIQCWQATYTEHVSEQFLQSLSHKKRTYLWEDNVANEKMHTFVLEKDGQLLGFVSGGLVRKENYPGYDAELLSLYVVPEHNGLGHGRDLLKHFLTLMNEQGAHKVYLRVIDDAASLSFFEKLGGQPIDVQDAVIDDEHIRLYTYGFEQLV